MTAYTAHLQLHAAALLVGVSAVLGQSLTVGPGLIVLGRAAFALLALSALLMLLKRRPWQGLSSVAIIQLMGLGLALGVHWILFFLAVQTGGVAVATLGFATFPAFTALIERLLGQPIGRRDLLILALVTIGLLLVTPSFDLADASTEGLLWGLLSGASYAAIAVVNKRFSTRIEGLTSCWWQCLAISLVLLPWYWSDIPQISARDWWQLMALGLICTALAYSLFIAALRQVRAHTAAVVIAMEPIYAIAGAWLVFGSAPTPGMLAGGALILGAVAWAELRPRS